MKERIKRYAVLVLIVTNIFVIGGVVGAYEAIQYDKGQAKQIQTAAQALAKSVPVAQASK